MRMLRVGAALLALSSTAFAQDFGVEWIDRITHELQQEQGPLPTVPTKFTAYGGVIYYYDNNVFREENNENADSIVIPWVRGRLDYSEPDVDAVADILLNYKWYSSEDEESDHEERFFGRARYVGSRLQAELAEVIRRESDPIDAVFTERVDRIVSNTFPRITYDINGTFIVEASANLQVVRFGDDAFEAVNNVNYRADISFIYRTPRDWDFLAQVGYLSIDYDESTSIDSTGWYGRLGFRGALTETISAEAYAGATAIQSDDIPATGVEAEHLTGDFGIHVRYLATSKLTVSADYGRRFSFATGADPFEVVDRALMLFEYQFNEKLSMRGRVQFEHVHPELGETRDYYSGSIGAEYKITSWLLVEGGGTYRASKTDGPGTEYDDMILRIGLAASY